MTDFDFDLFVIGGGSGGVRAARMSANYGARVGLAEEFRYGGTCVIRGCVPKKLLVYAGHFADDFEDAAGYGWSLGEAEFDWTKLIAAKDKEIDRLNGVYLRILGDNKVDLLDGRAVITGQHSVEIAGQEYSGALQDVSVDGLAVEISGPIPDAIGDATVILNGSQRRLEVPCRAVYSRGSIGGVKLGLHVLDRTSLAKWMVDKQ